MSTTLNDIYSVLWVDLRSLRHQWRSVIITSIVTPFLYLLVFGYGLGQSINVGGVSYLTFVIPGIIALTAFSTSFGGAAFKLQVDRFFFKSFDEFLMSPVSFFSIVVGKSLIGVVRGLISSVAILLVGIVLSPTLIVSPLFVLVLLVSCAVFAMFGVLAAFITPTHQGMFVFNSVVVVPMTFLCGTFLSLSGLPQAVNLALYVLPLTPSAQCLRAAALGQPFPWLSFALLLGYGVAFLFGSIFILQKTSV